MVNESKNQVGGATVSNQVQNVEPSDQDVSPEHVLEQIAEQYGDTGAGVETNDITTSETLPTETSSEINTELDRAVCEKLIDTLASALTDIALDRLRKLGASETIIERLKLTDAERAILTESGYAILLKHGWVKATPELTLALVVGQWGVRYIFVYRELKKLQQLKEQTKPKENESTIS
jgi:hypothetical protein